MVDYDVIVVGGGLVGCAFALDLARLNVRFNIAILEHQQYVEPEFRSLDNKIYAISPENINYLSSLNVWPDESRLGTINSMNVSGDAGGNIILDNQKAQCLFLAKTVEYKSLQHELYTRLCEMTNIVFIYDQLTNLIDTTSHIVLMGKKNNYTTSLVVGADGANSFIRSKSGIKYEQIDYEHGGVVANFKCELPHNNTAYQWFSGGAVLAYLPLPNNQISIVWACSEYEQLLLLPEADFCKQVAMFGENKLGILELVTKPVAFPLKLYLLDTVYSNRVVLIGDAAHTIHPLAGHGVNLGFGDAKILATKLSKHMAYQLGDKSILVAYNAKRLIHVRQMQLICHGLQRLFNLDNPFFMQVRNNGLNMVDKIPLLKKYLIKKAITY